MTTSTHPEEPVPSGYLAMIVTRRSCPECDDLDHGEHNRLDHGCAAEEVVARTGSLAAARLLAGKAAKRRPGATGTWWVVDRQAGNEVVAHG